MIAPRPRAARRAARCGARLAPSLALVVLAGCSRVNAGEPATDSVADSLVATARARLDSLTLVDSVLGAAPGFDAAPRGRAIRATPPDASPFEDSIARAVVFAPATQRWYLAVARAGHLVVDIGRVDLRATPARVAGIRRHAAAASPVAPGARFRVRGPWGDTVATVRGYDAWRGRLVALLDAPTPVDSTARRDARLVTAAELLEEGTGTDTAAGPASPGAASPGSADTAGVAPAPACARDPLPAALLARADVVRDSLLLLLQAKPPTVARLTAAVKPHAARATGCFGPARVLVAASLRAPAGEWIRERVVLVDTTGRVVPLAVRDLRYKAHDGWRAVDVDGDGVDDLAATGTGRGASGTVVLRLDLAARRLERLAGGLTRER